MTTSSAFNIQLPSLPSTLDAELFRELTYVYNAINILVDGITPYLSAQGVVTLVSGVAAVSYPDITADSSIFLTSQVDGGVPGFLRVSSRIPGTSFTITSSNAGDTSTVAYQVFN